jgi:hypothetical protein
MNKKGKILFFCMIFVSNAIFGQKSVISNNNYLLKHVAINTVQARIPAYLFKKDTTSAKPFLSPQFYSAHLGFFCKQEIKFDKITKIPFRFRLGSVDQCDRLEGKRKY